MLEQIYLSRKQVNIPSGTGFYTNQSWWVPWWESMLVYWRLGAGYDRIFHDGSQIEFARPGVSLPYYGYFDDNQMYAAYAPRETRYFPYPIDPFTLMGDPEYDDPIVNLQLNDNLNMPNRTCWPYFNRSKGWYVYVRQHGYPIYDAYAVVKRIADHQLIGEAKLNLGSVANYGVKLRWCSPTRLMVFLDYPGQSSRAGNGKVALFDWVSQELVFSSQIEPYYHAEYDHKNQVICSICPDGYMRVYTLQAEPAVLSNPEFLPSGQVYTGDLRKVRVRLTGAQNEPCPNYVVYWELQNHHGALRWERTKTGADGYAVNYYIAPTTPGDERITAWVVI